ncbi:hypothetical protein GCM10010112_69650 [Actinoplanes lobatus]|uniref:RHIM domain-containing protein n=1 Tax=Actinoplanes lobatus TaxID=113568 RepID=A0A7W7HM56_9ACTN|nr:hypothetical protein [Actinoplanes lobatus]MBB4753058.1 hypothetical protein [Actinoplanes lobatus]GGN87227.1 hypothetical protein GCM10010112_69650 [Actinoplanes lobatus]
MSALELIAAALAAGTGAGVTGVASTAVKDAYEQLKALLQHRPRAVKAIAELEGAQAGAETWQARLDGEDFEGDTETLTEARRLLDAMAQVPNWQVNLTRAQGVQFGPGSVQFNDFRS